MTSLIIFNIFLILKCQISEVNKKILTMLIIEPEFLNLKIKLKN